MAFVILLLLGLFALAHSLLLASLSEVAGSRAAVRELQVRGGAERAVWSSIATPAGSWMDSVAPWESRAAPRATFGRIESEGSLQRLGYEAWLARGRGRIDGSLGAETAVLAWSLDPIERVRALPAVVLVGPGSPVAISGNVDASGPAAVTPPMRPGDCAPWLDDLDAHYAAVSVPAVAALPDTLPSIGLLSFGAMMQTAPLLVSGTGMPAPSEVLGACRLDDPWGWGDPDRPWRPCGAHLAFRAAESDLWMSGGGGQGLLVVDGDLTLSGGARFFGIALVRGALRLEGAANFEGLAWASGGLSVASGASVRGSGCWAVRALNAHRERLGRFVVVDSGTRIGPL